MNRNTPKLKNDDLAKQKAQDRRRKLLVGSYFLRETQKIGELSELKRQMIQVLKRPSDKALFEDA